MKFERGFTPWNKGMKGVVKFTDIHKENIGNALRGKKYPGKKGHPHTEEEKIRISERMKGENNHRFGVRASPETRRKLSQALVGKNRGKGHPSAHKGKSRPEFSQEKHWNWQGGKTSENKTLRVSVQYRNWREAVFDRDDYTCQGCGERGVELNADHIKPFAYFPECRLQIDNGRTLCVPCHKTTDTYAGRAKKYAKTL